MASSIRGTLGWRHRAGKGGKPPVNRARALANAGVFLIQHVAGGGLSEERHCGGGGDDLPETSRAATRRRRADGQHTTRNHLHQQQRARRRPCAAGSFFGPAANATDEARPLAPHDVPATLALEMSMERSCSCSTVVKCVRRGAPLSEGEGAPFRLRQEGGRGSNQ